MPVLGFHGRYRCFSNFHPSQVTMDDIEYPSVEHAFQAAKTLDAGKAREIRKAETPGIAKRLGRKVPLRPGWESIKDQVMLELLRQKFSRHESLKRSLLATGDEYLEETNTWKDTYWGVCNGVGKNRLGKLLMQVRSELQQGANYGKSGLLTSTLKLDD